jgi:hypothetical protein
MILLDCIKIILWVCIKHKKNKQFPIQVPYQMPKLDIKLLKMMAWVQLSDKLNARI